MPLLDGRAALVTGGAQGNGAGIAAGLAEHGAAVVLADIDGDAAERTAAELESAVQGAVVAHRGDVGEPADAAAMVDRAVSEFGRLDVLVNNAGILDAAHFLALSREGWDRTLRVNLTGAMLVSQAAARHMADAGGGSIVNVTSIAARIAFRGTASYCASKGGLEMLTQVMAIDLAESGIRVNAIAPGFIKTPMTEPLYTTPEAVAELERHVPQARMGVPSDLAGAVVYLASDLAEYVTGSTIVVDGGTIAGLAAWTTG